MVHLPGAYANAPFALADAGQPFAGGAALALELRDDVAVGHAVDVGLEEAGVITGAGALHGGSERRRRRPRKGSQASGRTTP